MIEQHERILVRIPPGLLEQIDFVAKVEHRNRSDLIREALRRYVETFKRSTSTRVKLGPVNAPVKPQETEE